MSYPERLSNSSSKLFLEEDSFFRKAAACVPMLGTISSFFNETSLALKINQNFLSESNDFLVRHIEVKNHYKVASIIRETLSIAIIATLMALAILQGKIPLSVGGVSIAILGGLIAWHAHTMHHNKGIIKELNTTLSLKPSLKVK